MSLSVWILSEFGRMWDVFLFTRPEECSTVREEKIESRKNYLCILVKPVGNFPMQRRVTITRRDRAVHRMARSLLVNVINRNVGVSHRLEFRSVGSNLNQKRMSTAVKSISSAEKRLVIRRHLIPTGCAVELYQVSSLRMIGHHLLCLMNGNFGPIQCDGRYCSCVDENGKPIGPSVSIQNREQLRCVGVYQQLHPGRDRCRSTLVLICSSRTLSFAPRNDRTSWFCSRASRSFLVVVPHSSRTNSSCQHHWWSHSHSCK